MKSKEKEGEEKGKSVRIADCEMSIAESGMQNKEWEFRSQESESRMMNGSTLSQKRKPHPERSHDDLS